MSFLYSVKIYPTGIWNLIPPSSIYTLNLLKYIPQGFETLIRRASMDDFATTLKYIPQGFETRQDKGYDHQPIVKIYPTGIWNINIRLIITGIALHVKIYPTGIWNPNSIK